MISSTNKWTAILVPALLILNHLALCADQAPTNIPSSEGHNDPDSSTSIPYMPRTVTLAELDRSFPQAASALTAMVSGLATPDCEGSLDGLEAIRDIVDDMSHAKLVLDRSNGLDALLLPLTTFQHECSPKVRALAWITLGTALSNNPRLQKLALTKGIIDVISNRLQYSLQQLQTGSSEQQQQPGELHRLLYALSTLLRHFPEAQLALAHTPVARIVTQQFLDPSSPIATPQTAQRATAMVFDLGMENALLQSGFDGAKVCDALARSALDDKMSDSRLEETINALYALAEVCFTGDTALPEEIQTRVKDRLATRYSDYAVVDQDAGLPDFDDPAHTTAALFKKIGALTLLKAVIDHQEQESPNLAIPGHPKPNVNPGSLHTSVQDHGAADTDSQAINTARSNIFGQQPSRSQYANPEPFNLGRLGGWDELFGRPYRHTNYPFMQPFHQRPRRYPFRPGFAWDSPVWRL